jgi:hypothetical protein
MLQVMACRLVVALCLYKCTCVHTYIDAYIHTYIHTYINADRQTDRQTDSGEYDISRRIRLAANRHQICNKEPSKAVNRHHMMAAIRRRKRIGKNTNQRQKRVEIGMQILIFSHLLVH